MLFTDMDGVTTRYEVVEVEVLQPFAVEEMAAGEYELTLISQKMTSHKQGNTLIQMLRIS